MDQSSFKAIAIAFAALPLGLVAIAISRVFVTVIEAIGRNPSAADKIGKQGILGAALTEAIGLIIFVVILFMFFFM
jgi:F0F1-type ATP synthase membrane subunit c/vacuolar-type H+-ATPase subunit K